MLYDAILFDFDGVLADTEPIHFACWMEAFKPLGIQTDWPTYVKHCVGLPHRRTAEFLSGLSDPAVDLEKAWAQYERKRELFRARMLAAPPVPKSVVDLLKSLDSYRLAVVSASARSEIEPPLVAAGIRPCFGALVCGEDTARSKPAPDPYLLAARLLGARSALVVEDSDAGVASGLAAGFRVLRVPGPLEMPALLREKLAAEI